MRAVFDWVQAFWRSFGLRKAGLTAQLDDGVEQHGWSAIYVGDYRTAPTWTYTIGFTETLGAPEVIIFDLPQEAANGLLWEAFSQLKDGRLVLEDHRIWPEDEARPCVWRKVDPSQIESGDGWFTFATMRSIVRTGMPFEFEAFQLVLSDNDGRLPWDDGYDERLRPLQRALYLPLEEARSPLAAEGGV